MGFLFGLALGALAVFLKTRAAAPAPAAGGTTPATVPSSSGTTTSAAMLLNAVLHGGSAAQKQAAVMAYQKAKGMAQTGVYTQDVYDALVQDGIGAPPAPVTSADA